MNERNTTHKQMNILYNINNINQFNNNNSDINLILLLNISYIYIILELFL